MESFFFQLSLTVIGGAIGSGLTMWVGGRQFRSQRWWDRKADAYIAIIDAFHDLLDEDEAYWEAAINRDSTPPKEEATALRVKAAAAEAKIERQRRLASFLIDDRADRALRTMKSELVAANQTNDWNEYREHASAALWKGFDALKIVAAEDLGVSRKSPFFPLILDGQS